MFLILIQTYVVYAIILLRSVQFGGSEAIITAVSDEYPLIKRNREIFVALLFSFYFIVGLASCTQGGVYIVHFMDRFAAGYSILFAVLFEAIAVSWIYGRLIPFDSIYRIEFKAPSLYDRSR